MRIRVVAVPTEGCENMDTNVGEDLITDSSSIANTSAVSKVQPKGMHSRLPVAMQKKMPTFSLFRAIGMKLKFMRERVKRRRAQSSLEATQSPVEAPIDGN
ncbi:formin-binding protein 4 isoform X3 [Cucumis melo var. makuwa]|uniref:Formin-binding protein 4 isoform X3 n=1 Tax=Cucumis melo var. makuwa TaxID=1194695 RepID=A0A5A7UZH0_CUCMM|nr:formin-binding protein 4 isoform X3 [Cucumis melo var. makuwa]